MRERLKKLPIEDVKLLPSIFKDRFALNREYMMSLENKNLLQNHYLEASQWKTLDKPEKCHWGWESPTCQLRGHFLGHWLSAAAVCYRVSNNFEIKAKADKIVAELARCQEVNGGEWAGSIPEKYLDWIAKGKKVWAPQYTLHKTLMGLIDMYRFAENKQALDILCKFADWFYRWSGKFGKEEFNDILDVETGGMLEVWADLYEITGNDKHLTLLKRYDRRRLFEPLLEGKDVLTNMHANTTIPEILGAARAWEVTGEERWFNIVTAYWEQAVSKRGFFCTGGQTSGEVWTPPYQFSARLGDKNQEHCTVYNMMRLADFLFRWTGQVTYADYWERNLYNGILAQQNSATGMVAYFLPLEAGAQKRWGTPTDDFWCCHGTLVQAHTNYNSFIFYEDKEGLYVSQYIPSRLTWQKNGGNVILEQTISSQTDNMVAINEINPSQKNRPNEICINYKIQCDRPLDFAIKFRVPWWMEGKAKVEINGQAEAVESKSSSLITINRSWQEDEITIKLPKRLSTVSLPDSPQMVAFMDGPVVLAGLIDKEVKLYGDLDDPASILEPDNEREWMTWLSRFRTHNQNYNIRFKPLYEIKDEKYTTYFPMGKS